MIFKFSNFLLSILNVILITSHAESLSCYFCNSTLHYNCAIDPTNNLPIKECEKDANVCTVYIRESETIRDCGKSRKSEDLYYECQKSLCNNNIYPEDRLKCYHCDGIDCIGEKAGNVQICQRYKKSDTCFTAVIDESDAIRGCSSEQELDIPYLETCNDNACNNKAGVTKEFCIECDGSTHKSCIRNQDGSNGQITTNATCSVNILYGRLHEQCFTYHRFENVSRGCMSYAGKIALEPKQYLKTCIGDNCNNIPIPIQKCATCIGNITHPECEGDIQTCSKEHTTCYTCSSYSPQSALSRGCEFTDSPYETCNRCQNKEGCNNESFKSCLTCTSEHHVECLSLIEPYPRYGQGCEITNSSCITLINNRGYLERGCTSEKLQCSLGSKDYCRECKGHDCNNDTIAEDVLKCYQCGLYTECSYKDLNSKLYACNFWRKNTVCFEYIHESGNVQRGCSSDNEEYSECLGKGKDCLTCKSHGCNNVLATKRKPQLGCAMCNSIADPMCRWTPTWYSFCKTHPFFNQTEYCYTYTNTLGFTKRGCSLDDSMCLSDDIDDCKICNTTMCNNNVATAQVCLNGTITEGANNNQIAKIECIDVETSCYVKRNASEITWGCSLDLSESGAKECLISEECKTCMGDSCEHMTPPPPRNSKPYSLCHSCHSVIDPNCATSPANTPAIECDGDKKSCYTAIIGTATIRGCMSSNIVLPDQHAKCIGNYCNNKVFPENRLKCHQCKGTVECSLKQNLYFTNPCKIYNNITDECFEYLFDSKHVVRGCSSDIDEYKICQEHISDCKECNTNGCNNKYWPLKKPVLSCIKCNSRIDKNCQWTQNSTLREICTNTHPSEFRETCYSLKRENGFVQRGCSIDDEICNTEKCSNCTTNGCNIKLLIPQICVQVTIENGSSQMPIKSDCNATEQTNQTQGCYVEKRNKTIIWGCAVDLEPSKLADCKNSTYKYCNFCMGMDCEKMEAPFSEKKKNNGGFSIIFTNCYYLLTILSLLQFLVYVN